VAITSSTGAIMRQGGHHEAPNSPSMGMSDASTAVWNVASFTVLSI
jgi:hypothetical protein